MVFTIGLTCFSQAPASFKHPGILSSQAELDTLKNAVQSKNGSPQIAGYNKLAAESKGSLTYKATPYANVHVIASGIGNEEAAFRNDAHALYIHAIKWVVTGNTAHRDKAIEIADAWGNTFKTLVAESNKPQQPTLEASWAVPIWCAGAEILKYYNNGESGWNSTNFESFVKKMLTYVNGSIASAPNWYISKYLSLMSAGVFLNSTSIYNSGYNGVTGQIDAITSGGVIPELSRDFVHSQYVLIGMTMCAEVAHQQGDNGLFTRTNNRLKTGAEAYAQSVLGTISPNYNSESAWARHSAPYEILLNRYTELGIDIPYTTNYVLKMNRPEDGSEDHFVGWLSATHAINASVISTDVPGNLAYKKSVTASSVPQPENPAKSANDNNNYTRWAASGYPQWIEIDLGSVQKINKTELIGYENRAYQFKVDVKKESSGEYEMVVDRTANTTPATEAAPLADQFAETEARYVRLTVTGAYNYTGTWVSITEFRIFLNDDTNGISETPMGKKERLILYPNPATDVLQVKGEDGIRHIKVYNSIGELVFMNVSANEKTVNLDVSALKAGIYMCQISYLNGKVDASKFMIR